MERLTQKQREQELAVIVQNSLAALLSKLDSEERKTSRTKGSTPPRTFEDKARAIAESPRDPRAAVVRASLSAFQNAVNALWVFSIEHRLPERLAATWVRKHRADAAPLAREDVEAEVMFALRHQIILRGNGCRARVLRHSGCSPASDRVGGAARPSRAAPAGGAQAAAPRLSPRSRRSSDWRQPTREHYWHALRFEAAGKVDDREPRRLPDRGDRWCCH